MKINQSKYLGLTPTFSYNLPISPDPQLNRIKGLFINDIRIVAVAQWQIFLTYVGLRIYI